MKFDLNAPNPTAPFRRIPAGMILERTIQDRLPQSAMMCNMLRFEEIAKTPIKFEWYTLHGTNCPDSWIVAAAVREDDEYEYIISRPADDTVFEQTKGEFMKALQDSTVVQWSKDYLFCSIDASVVPLVVEASLGATGSRAVFSVSMSNEYFLSAEDAKKIVVPTVSGVEVKPLDPDTGSKFLTEELFYKKTGTDVYAKNCVIQLPSAGVYVGGELVSALLSKRHGTIGMTYTSPDHRRKGYATLAMNLIMKQWGEAGLHPCFTVITDNETSNNFHKKHGLAVSHKVAFLYPEAGH